MKKLIAFTVGLLMLLLTATPAGCFWLDNTHWVDDNVILIFEKQHVHVFQLMPEFNGYVSLGTWTHKRAKDYLNWWYYIHSI